MTERQITFEEIKPGDHIRMECVDEHIGTKFMVEGVAHQLADWNSSMWETEKHGIIADKTREDEVYFLIQPELPTEPGSVIVATEVRGYEGEWSLFLHVDGDWLSDEVIGIDYWHQPEHITAWKPAKVVPA